MANTSLRKQAATQIAFGAFWLMMIAFWWDGVDPATRRFVLVTIMASTHMSVGATLFMIRREQNQEQPPAEAADQ